MREQRGTDSCQEYDIGSLVSTRPFETGQTGVVTAAESSRASDRRKGRAGLAMIVTVVLASIVLVFVAPSPVLKFFFGGVLVAAFFQMWRLTRLVRD